MRDAAVRWRQPELAPDWRASDKANYEVTVRVR